MLDDDELPYEIQQAKERQLSAAAPFVKCSVFAAALVAFLITSRMTGSIWKSAAVAVLIGVISVPLVSIPVGIILGRLYARKLKRRI